MHGIRSFTRAGLSMNYRHAYHAGNFADVVKHVALVAILQHLRKKETAFAVIDTHAGRGLYDLSAAEAKRTGESSRGVGRLGEVREAPEALATYLELVRAAGPDCYPGSPLIAARLLRSQDRLVAIEKHADEATALEAVLAPFRKARVVRGDGYALLAGLLPPVEHRGLVLIDPPYEEETEFRDAGRTLASAHRRFASGSYLLWFPAKSRDADLLCGELLASGIRKMVRLDIDVGSPSGARDGALTSSGLVVVNPPFGFADEMRACFAVLEPLLAVPPQKRALTKVSPLAGD
jgi:23S rRNA (adenine2030-N6)-methyltransferase